MPIYNVIWSPFCVHWHRGLCLRLLVPNYAVVFRLGRVYLPVSLCHWRSRRRYTLDGTPLKLVDKFTYLGSSVASTEKDIDTRLTKAWTAINRLSIIWKSDLTDKMKRSFFQATVTSILHYMDSNKTTGEEARRQLHKNAACNLEQVLAATPHKTPTVRPPASYHENYSS